MREAGVSNMRLSALIMRCKTALTLFNTEHPFDTALILLAVIGDGIATETSIRYINHTVVKSGKYGVKYLYYPCQNPPTFPMPVPVFLQ